MKSNHTLNRNRHARRTGAWMLGGLLAMSGALVASTALPPTPALGAPGDCVGAVSLINGGFEQPVLPGSGGYQQVPQANVPSWATTDANGSIEIWQSGFGGGGAPVPAAEGNQFAELNAFSAGTLYQDVATTPGQTITWSLQHRGRLGADTMRVIIGDPAVPLDQLPQSGPDLTDDQTAWGPHTGGYVVPAGQTLTRFGFQAVSSSGGNQAVGNFLDDITFGTGPCLEGSKQVEKLTNANDPEITVGDHLRYTIEVVNRGSSPATDVVSRDQVPAGLDFVPNSLRIAGGSATDAIGDDPGELSGGTVVARLGAGATASGGGNLARDATTSYSFDVVVTEDAAAGRVVNSAEVDYEDPIAGEQRTETTNEVVTPIVGHPELTLTKSSTPSVPGEYRAGERIVYEFSVKNTGNVTVTGIAIDETAFSGSGQLSGIDCEPGAGSLAPGNSITCTGWYALTQADIDSGRLTNTAVATGEFRGARVRSAGSSTSLTATAAPGLSMVKTANVDKVTRAGQTVTYSFQLTNTGNVSLHALTVEEGAFSGTGALGEVTCPAERDRLLPGRTMTCTARYRVAEGDLTGRPLSNAAAATAAVPSGATVEAAESTARIGTVRPAEPNRLPETGAAGSTWVAGISMLALLVGTGAILSALRRRHIRA